MPILYAFQFLTQITELISAHLQGKIECDERYTLCENNLSYVGLRM